MILFESQTASGNPFHIRFSSTICCIVISRSVVLFKPKAACVILIICSIVSLCLTFEHLFYCINRFVFPLQQTSAAQAELYKALIRVAMRKQDEVRKIIMDTVASESENIIQRAGSLTLTGLWNFLLGIIVTSGDLISLLAELMVIGDAACQVIEF